MQCDQAPHIVAKRLERFFYEKSGSEGVRINPTIRSEDVTRLTDRLYEEEHKGRLFIVYMSQNELNEELDAFVKWTGLAFDVQLLGVFSPPDERWFPALWRLYLEWIHGAVSEEAVLELATSLSRSG